MWIKRVIDFNWGYGVFWFRLFSRGLYFKNTKVARLLFSERNGYVKHVRIGRLFIGVLKRTSDYESGGYKIRHPY